ncbi:GTP 3',8-cyclase [Longispora fulva]|uniref:GTP 3',8-cyclase n=1 Tax=Longispora fulva TaxID=619741 RepID=A0A8J7GMP4_9ACTN|nr:GTP 3',8-cyclase MoaA [Longispora fulva]MBG6139703.1 cyclic pyranopterin phosphate synthase [Longispora fulva]GIG57914.1 GTP 3',8-cyclase [Longispora fulva]
MLQDQYGRVATDLRVSLTDRCSLRCTYCMPPEGLPWLPSADILTDAEIIRLVGIATSLLGVTEVRYTGGEPLLRPGLVEIVRNTPAHTSLTTNALGLTRLAAPLAEAGLNRVNISLDTLDRDTFIALAHRDRLADTLDGIAAAAAAGLTPVKINTVLLREHNAHEAPSLLAFAIEHGYELRFIEQMPLDAQHGWHRENMVTGEEILASLATRFTLTPDLGTVRGSNPAETWLVDGGPAKVGVIASVTRPFCGDCDRTRLTADGQVRNCLFARGETDLRGPLREGASDEDIAELWRKAMWGKLPGHGIDDPTFLQPDRPMSAIGG